MIVQVNVVLTRTVFDSDYIMFTRTIMLNLLTKYHLQSTVFQLSFMNIMTNRIYFNTRTRGSYIPGGEGGAYNWVNVLLSGKCL